MRARFLVLSSILALSTAAHGATVRLRDFYPLRDGAQWIYDKVGRNVQRGAWSTNSTNSWSTSESDRFAKVSQSIAGRTTNWVQLYSSSGFSLDHGEYLRVNRLGLALLSENLPGNRSYDVFGDAGNQRLTNRIRTNSRTRSVTRIWGKDSYHGSGGLVRFVGANAATTRVGGFQTIITPSGTYRALRVTVIEHRAKVYAAGIRETSDSITRAWLARGVGLVKQVEIERKRQYLNNRLKYFGYSREVSSLTEYLPNGPGNPQEEEPEPTNILAGVYAADPYQYESGHDYTSEIAAAVGNVASSATAVSPPVSGAAYGTTESLTSLSALQLSDNDVQNALRYIELDGGYGDSRYLRLELSYDPEALAAQGITEDDLRPMWWDEDNQAWVVGGTTIYGERGASTQATEEWHQYYVGYWGIDTEAHVLWVNINHASTYGLIVPEPATVSLLGLGALAILRRRRR